MDRKHRFMVMLFVSVVVFVSTTFRSVHDLSWVAGTLPYAMPSSSSNSTTTATSSTTTTTTTPPQQQSSFLLPKSDVNFKVVTKIERQDCELSPHQPIIERVSTFPQYQDPSRFWKTTKMDENHDNYDHYQPWDICTLRTDKKDSSHFPHVMQQLYACYTYWQRPRQRQRPTTTFNFLDPADHTNQQQQQQQHPLKILMPSTSTLTDSQSLLSKHRQNPFLNGFLQTLQHQMNVQIKTRHEISTTMNRSNSVEAQIFDVAGGYILSNASALNDMVQREFDFSSSKNSNGRYNDKDDPNVCTPPTIGILNRRPSAGRSISNAATILDALSSKLSNVNILEDVEYFEQKSFAQQVAFFQSVDILISPHGAQLTGIPFLGYQNNHQQQDAASKCRSSQLLEVFPKGYLIPHFFGSLAVNAGVGYSYMYLSSSQDASTEQATTIEQRKQARAQTLCPDPNVIVEAVTALVEHFRTCQCRNRP